MRNMLDVIKRDCRSTTGRNLRKIMLLQHKACVEDISIEEFKQTTYNVTPLDEEWRINLAREIFDEKVVV